MTLIVVDSYTFWFLIGMVRSSAVFWPVALQKYISRILSLLRSGSANYLEKLSK